MNENPWKAEFAERLKGKYCIIQTAHLNEQDQVLATEQFHGIVVDARPDRGIWFRLRGMREGEDWIGPPDLAAFEEAPGKGKFTLSETGEVVSNPDFVIFWRFYESPSKVGHE